MSMMTWVRRVSMVAILAGSGAAQAAGTSLSLLFDAVDPATEMVCSSDGSGATVTFEWTLTSTGSADSAVLTGSIDGGATFALPGVASGNVTNGGGWTFAGRMKTADGSYTSEPLANGEHTFTVCATQSGANGTAAKTTCSTQTVTVNCQSSDPCAKAEKFFGELVGNTNLCQGNGNIEVQFGGNFGENATLTITDQSNSIVRMATVPRNGGSCTYHYNWTDPQGDTDEVAGTYTFTVTGNGKEVVGSEVLSCSTPGHP